MSKCLMKDKVSVGQVKQEFFNALIELPRKYRLVAKSLVSEWGDGFFEIPGTHPSALGMRHHTENTGLARHSLAVRNIALGIAKTRYANGGVDLSLLAFSALIHDIGKLYEFFDARCRGLGHVGVALMLVPQVMEKNGFSEDTIIAVCHCIASHHKYIERGALVFPQTREAHILASADKLDQELWCIDHGGKHENP